MVHDPVHSLDLRGTPCPMNFVRIKLELDRIGPGGQLHVTADGGETGRDILCSLEAQGFLVWNLCQRDEEVLFEVSAPPE